MAKIVDSCCAPSSMTVQLTKPDKNNNTTANIDDGIILPSENCDVIEDGTGEKSKSTDDSNARRCSSTCDDDVHINNNTIRTEMATVASSSLASNDEIDASIHNGSTTNSDDNNNNNTYNDNDNNNNNNTSTNSVSTSAPYKDFSGVDTESFIATTLRNNPKDRTLLLTLESLFQRFIQDDEQKSHQLQAMNSYERMIVHRVAAFFGLDHNVDKNGQAVVVTKTPNTRIPNFSFQKCIPEDEIAETANGTSTAETSLSMTNSNEVPTRRILRRHEKHPNHEHSQRNGHNDESTNQQITSTNKHQQLSKPYLERVTNYAETRARIFNDNADVSNTSTVNKSTKTNQKQHSNFVRPSYRKQQQQLQHQNSSQQHRPYAYQHSQQAANSHIQQYPTGKTHDPSSHMINTSANRASSIYTTQQAPSANLSIPQPPPPIYASIVGSNSSTTPLRPPAATTFYTQSQQAPVDYDYKQQATGAHIYNYVPMIHSATSNFIHPQQPTQQIHAQSAPSNTNATTTTSSGPNPVASQHASAIPLPILVHQQPTGQIQYLFPAHHLSQQTQPPPPTNAYSLAPDGTYVQVYRSDTIPMPGPSSIVDTNHTHHHPYSQNHHHAIAQQQQQQPQTQQQAAPSQSNLAPQPAPFVRIFPTGTPANVTHPYTNATYQPVPPPPSQTAYVPPGTMSATSFMMPPTAGNVQAYPTFDNSIPYNAYGPNTGKANMTNNGTSVQYVANHLATLNLQNQHDDYQTRLINNQQTRFSHSNGATTNNQQRNFMGRPLVQSPNGSTTTPRMPIYSTSNQQHRQNRPVNISNTDKQITSIENDSKSLTLTQQHNNCDNISLAGPAQE